MTRRPQPATLPGAKYPNVPMCTRPQLPGTHSQPRSPCPCCCPAPSLRSSSSASSCESCRMSSSSSASSGLHRLLSAPAANPPSAWPVPACSASRGSAASYCGSPAPSPFPPSSFSSSTAAAAAAAIAAIPALAPRCLLPEPCPPPPQPAPLATPTNLTPTWPPGLMHTGGRTRRGQGGGRPSRAELLPGHAAPTLYSYLRPFKWPRLQAASKRSGGGTTPFRLSL